MSEFNRERCEKLFNGFDKVVKEYLFEAMEKDLTSTVIMADLLYCSSYEVAKIIATLIRSKAIEKDKEKDFTEQAIDMIKKLVIELIQREEEDGYDIEKS